MRIAAPSLSDSHESVILSAERPAAERPRFSAVRSSRLLASLLGRDELRDRHVATFAHASPVQFDPCDFMESFGSQVAGSAMRATNDRHFLNHQQRRAASIAASYWSDLNTSASAVFAAVSLTVIPHIQ